MNFSLEIGPKTDLDTLPTLKDVYITMLPGGDFKDTADQAIKLVEKHNIISISNKCPKIEHSRIFGNLGSGGFYSGLISSKKQEVTKSKSKKRDNGFFEKSISISCFRKFTSDLDYTFRISSTNDVL